MRPEDARLVAALILLRDRLDPIIDEITAGLFDDDERRALAEVLATIAADLNADLIVPDLPTARGGVCEVNPVWT